MGEASVSQREHYSEAAWQSGTTTENFLGLLECGQHGWRQGQELQLALQNSSEGGGQGGI